ncbi:hypothetical protein [Nocardia sp. R6R-6]|uniref:hypothetical protein n=1 Tax=Nocardia sp. R6R-6 TaxID=3459303 RepID=UPI00403D6B8E
MPYTYGGPGVVYVTDSGAGTVLSVPAAGGAPTTLAVGLNFPAGLALSGTTLYVCEFGANRVVTVPTAGGMAAPLVTGLNGPTDIVISGSTLFITNSNSQTVVTAPITGGAPTVISGPAGFTTPFGITI